MNETEAVRVLLGALAALSESGAIDTADIGLAVSDVTYDSFSGKEFQIWEPEGVTKLVFERNDDGDPSEPGRAVVYLHPRGEGE